MIDKFPPNLSDPIEFPPKSFPPNPDTILARQTMFPPNISGYFQIPPNLYFFPAKSSAKEVRHLKPKREQAAREAS